MRLSMIQSFAMAFFVSIAVVSVSMADEPERWGGEVMLSNGESYQADEFNISSDTRPLKFRLVDEQKERLVRWEDIAKIEIVEFKSGTYDSDSSRFFDCLGEGTIMVLTLRNGNSTRVILNPCLGSAALRVQRLGIRYVDEFTGEEAISGFKWKNVRAVSFGSDIGRLRYDDEANEFFPATYNFNPYTGRKLIWRNPGYKDNDEL